MIPLDSNRLRKHSDLAVAMITAAGLLPLAYNAQHSTSSSCTYTHTDLHHNNPQITSSTIATIRRAERTPVTAVIALPPSPPPCLPLAVWKSACP